MLTPVLTSFKALPPGNNRLAPLAIKSNIKGETIADPNTALKKAKSNSTKDDLILVTGSTFVIAELDQL